VKPLILLCNDDGIHAAGIQILASRLADLGEVVVVAPDRNRSASSHAITLDRPLLVAEVAPGQYSVDGTPADCVYLGVHHVAGRKPDLVVSGINDDYNLGSDFFFSGTVAAAVEAAIHGVPAFAISLERGPSDGLGPASDFAHALAHAILAAGLPTKTLLNVNVPNRPIEGYQWTRLGERIYSDEVEVVNGQRGRRYYYCLGSAKTSDSEPPGADTTAVRSGLVSITPLDLDLTSRSLLATLPGWRLAGFEAIMAEEGMSPPR